KWPQLPTPALLIRTSRPSKRSTTRSSSRARSASEVMSAVTAITSAPLAPSDAVSSSSLSLERAATATRAPSLVVSPDRRRPLPLEAPVMRAQRPRRSPLLAPLFSLPFLSHPFAALYPNLPDHDVVLEDFRNTETALSGVGALQHLQPSASLYPTESD